MDSDVKNKVEYIIAVISEFAAAHSLNTLQAYRYLERFKGLDFVSRFYNVEHTLSFEDVIEDLNSILPQERRGIGMILYHGSNTDIAEIDLSVSKVGKDFGCGFYLSADKEQALELAARKTEQLGVGTPMLNSYEFDENSLHGRGLSVLEFQEYSREWAEFVLMNRRNRTRVPSHSYDIVIGPIVMIRLAFRYDGSLPG